MSRAAAIRLVFAVLAVGFFAAPIAARVVGVTAERFENRRLADPPKLSQGWSAFQQASRYLTDRMPLRAQAVRANTRIWTDVFDTDPPYARDDALAGDRALPFAGAIEHQGGAVQAGVGADRADTQIGRQPQIESISGRRDWVFHSTEFSEPCANAISDRLLLERWGGLVQAVRATGREAVMFAVPTKASVYPEYLPAKYPFDDCALEEKDRLWRLLAHDGARQGVIELRSELRHRKARFGDQLFQRRDTHWTTLGALALLDGALDEVGDGVRIRPHEIVDRGSKRYTGDLDRLIGSTKTDERAEREIVRAPNAPRVPGRTLLVCDSYVYRWMRIFKPYFEHVRYVDWYSDAEEIADAIRRSDRVIFEAYEFLLISESKGDGLARLVARELAGGSS